MQFDGLAYNWFGVEGEIIREDVRGLLKIESVG